MHLTCNFSSSEEADSTKIHEWPRPKQQTEGDAEDDRHQAGEGAAKGGRQEEAGAKTEIQTRNGRPERDQVCLKEVERQHCSEILPLSLTGNIRKVQIS